MILKIISELLRALRENLNILQAKLAHEIDITHASVNRYETNKIVPTAETLLWYASRFDVLLDYIFSRAEEPQGQLRECQVSAVQAEQTKEIAITNA